MDSYAERAAARPFMVTLAGTLLIIAGFVTVVESIVLFVLGGISATYTVLSVIYLIIGVLQWLAGARVLALRKTGRLLGALLSALGAIVAIVILSGSTRNKWWTAGVLVLNLLILAGLLLNWGAFTHEGAPTKDLPPAE